MLAVYLGTGFMICFKNQLNIVSVVIIHGQLRSPLMPAASASPEAC